MTVASAFVALQSLRSLRPAHRSLVITAGYFRLPGDCPIYVAAAELQPDRLGRRRIVSGRGGTPTEALECALKEAVERASALYHGDEPVRRASQSSIDVDFVAPGALTLFSESQYRQRDAWNGSVTVEHRIPPPLDQNAEIDWLASGTSTGEVRFVPASYCLLGHPSAFRDNMPIPDSSGCAAGESRDAAVVAGFLELVERDAVAIWWYGRLARPTIEIPASIASFVKAFADWFASLGRQIRLIDLTHDFVIPVVAAVGTDEGGCDLSFGFAAAPTPAQAIRNALGELVQFEITAGLRITAAPSAARNRDWIDWCRTAQINEHPHLWPVGPGLPALESGGLSIERCAALCRARDLDLLNVDLTRPDAGTPVVKVIVPGLRPLWPRFAPGRLFDVPVRAGWQPRHLPENRLNPIPILY